MSFYDAIRVGASGVSDLEVERSLRFNRNDGAYLQATLGDGNEDKWTWSGWVKKTINGQHQNLFSSGSDAVYTHINFDNSDRLRFQNWHSAQKGTKITTRVLRDNSAWMHIVVIWDSGNSTADDRMRLYINGTRETDFSSSSNPDQNQDSVINGNTLGGSDYGEGKHFIGKFADTSDNSGSYKSEINFIDGQAYDPSYFGETDAITGQWKPKKYSGGGYGTNGFYLKFADNSGTTATTLGKDSSGNGHNFTPNNFSVAAGTGNDSLEDTPLNNFCTLNPLDKTNGASLREGALTLYTDSNDQAATGTFAVNSGKWYWEVDMNEAEPEIGIAHHNMPLSNKGTSLPSNGQIALIVAGADGNTNFLRVDGNNASGTGITAQSGPGKIGIALDADNKKIWFTNTSGTYFNSGNPATGANAAVDFSSTGPNYPTGLLTPFVSMYQGSAKTVSINFGQRPFTYSAPTGFKTLCSANLPDPTILLPNKNFGTLTYSGNSSTQVITDTSAVDFTPDWVWVKRRNGDNSHILTDAVRGIYKYLVSSRTDAEGDNNIYLTAFNNGGFTSGNNGDMNVTGRTYVAWNWNGGDTDGKTYTVKVVSDSGNKYRFDNFGTSAVTLDLAEGGTYIFNMDDSSNASHPFSIGTAANGTVYTSGITYFLDGVSKTYSQYTSGFSSASTRRLHITVPASAPQLYYWCSVHSGMGGAINTNTTLGSSNFDGNTQSTVKVNAAAGFSIVGYTGPNGAGNIGHGLGVAPKVLIIRRRPNASDWAVYHGEIGNTKRLVLNSTSGESSASANWWNNTSPTSTIFTVGSDAGTGGSTDTYIAYCFSEVAGYSKFGKYTGNANANGTLVHTGFQPAWLMLKRTDSGDHWIIKDSKRNTTNDVFSNLGANINNAEFGSSGNVQSVDFLSNGFKLRGTDSGVNANSGTYIYLAFAESPFKNSRAR